MEFFVPVFAARVDSGYGGRSGVHGRSGGEFFCARRQNGREAVEFSDRRGTSRVGGDVRGSGTPIRGYADGVGIAGGRGAVAGVAGGGDVSWRIDADGVRAAGGIAVRGAWLALFPVVAWAQGIVAHGADVFAATCGSGYCHGP